MIITSLLQLPARTLVVALPYAIVRAPLTVVDRAILQQLPAGSRSRTVFDHGLGTADHWVGLIVANDRIVDSGRARIAQAGRFVGRGVDAVAPPPTRPFGTSYAVTRPGETLASQPTDRPTRRNQMSDTANEGTTDDTSEQPEPTKTDHPAGEDQAAENADNESAS